MSNAPSIEPHEASLTRDILYAFRYYLGHRRTLFVLAALLIIVGIALNWGWLAAIGVAPILIALLPCAVMCALGLCMQKMTGGAHGGKAKIVQASTAQDRIAEAPGLVDPVSRRPLRCATAVAAAHQGRVYYFESRSNRDAFEADPERYLAKLQANRGGSRLDHSGHGNCCA